MNKFKIIRIMSTDGQYQQNIAESEGRGEEFVLSRRKFRILIDFAINYLDEHEIVVQLDDKLFIFPESEESIWEDIMAEMKNLSDVLLRIADRAKCKMVKHRQSNGLLYNVKCNNCTIGYHNATQLDTDWEMCNRCTRDNFSKWNPINSR